MSTRKHIHAPRHLGDRVADAVVSGMGSWKFIIIQTMIVVIWIVSNLWLLSRPFDPFPLILLNLVFSTQAAYASPLILMASNRQTIKDRVRDDLEAIEVDTMSKEQAEIKQVQQEIKAISLQQNEILEKHEKILDQQTEILELIRGRQKKS